MFVSVVYSGNALGQIFLVTDASATPSQTVSEVTIPAFGYGSVSGWVLNGNYYEILGAIGTPTLVCWVEWS